VAREVANEPVDDELREFALDGEAPAPADPAFQDGLREKLWRMLRRRLGKGENEPLD
jgi:hypothetical protein